MKQIITTAIFIAFVNIISGQEIRELSLKEAQEFALQNNYDIKNAKTDVKIAKKTVKENVAIGLPQINGRISNTNYIDIPTTLIPDFITPVIYQVNIEDFGLEPEEPLGDVKFFPAQFGTEYNATAEVSATQLVFSGKYFIGIKTANTFLEKEKMEYFKNELEVKEAVTSSYYFVLILEENNKTVQQTLQSLIELADQTRETYEMGFIEETDADQVDLLVSDLKANLIILNNQIEIGYSRLKYTLGLNINDSIKLTDDLGSLIKKLDYLALINQEFNYNDNIEYKIFIRQKQIAFNQLRLKKSEYLPTLTAFFTAQTNAMRNEYNFFDTDEPWYPSTFWGVEMSVPVFSSGNRSAKVQKAKLELQKMNEIDSKLVNGLQINVNSARNDFYSAYLVYQNKKKDMALAKKIYEKNGEKFKEGIASSMDLLQAHNQYLKAESEYFNSILDMVSKKLKLEKLLTTE